MSHKVPDNFIPRDPLFPDVNGKCQKKFVVAEITEILRDSDLVGYIPVDARRYNITSAFAEEWALFFTFKIESFHDYQADRIETVNDEERVGLFQLIPREVGFTKSELLNPRKNILAAIDHYAKVIRTITNNNIFDAEQLISGTTLQEFILPGRTTPVYADSV